ncbi:MAG: UDP-N-acetylmuramate dehydrogenase [Bacilli bacterium]|nr:UDP-N-acetylmuramate dehydrogenase [Bacilli bacterium]
MINELKEFAEVIEHASLKKYNTYRIDGKTKYLIFPKSINDLIKVLEILKENNIKYYVLGNGSNVVINDKEYNGATIILSKLNGIEIHPELQMAYAEAGAMLPVVAKQSVEKSLTGLEFAAGIPGTIGGAIYGNAGAYNSCILDYVSSVTVLDENLNVKVLEHEDITYGYRTSLFKEEKKYIILGAKFYLKEGDKENSLEMIETRQERRRETQPLEYPSAGSVFRNPEGDFAGRLIESCNLKGHKLGGAEVSEKHANFVINKDNATGKDIHDLIEYIHDEVYKKTKVDLHIEQEFIDWE